MAQQPGVAALREHGLECVAQEAVFAAQVDEAAAGPDQARGHRHGLEDGVRVAGQQHAVLEGAGLAFVGVADDHARAAFGHRRAARGVPLVGGDEAGTAAAAQVGGPQLAQRGRIAA